MIQFDKQRYISHGLEIKMCLIFQATVIRKLTFLLLSQSTDTITQVHGKDNVQDHHELVEKEISTDGKFAKTKHLSQI